MIPLIPFPLEAEARPLTCEYWSRYFAPREVRLISHYAAKQREAILEIGTNEGKTLRELASFGRFCIGVDCTSNPSLPKFQDGEMPTPETIGHHAKSLPNVQIIDLHSTKLLPVLLTLPPIDFVLIDASHDYAGVKNDTEVALEYFRSRQRVGHAFNALILWHDCDPNRINDPDLKVYPYLMEELLPKLPLKNIQTTAFGYLELDSSMSW